MLQRKVLRVDHPTDYLNEVAGFTFSTALSGEVRSRLGKTRAINPCYLTIPTGMKMG